MISNRGRKASRQGQPRKPVKQRCKWVTRVRAKGEPRKAPKQTRKGHWVKGGSSRWYQVPVRRIASGAVSPSSNYKLFPAYTPLALCIETLTKPAWTLLHIPRCKLGTQREYLGSTNPLTCQGINAAAAGTHSSVLNQSLLTRARGTNNNSGPSLRPFSGRSARGQIQVHAKG